eukprot:UN28478
MGEFFKGQSQDCSQAISIEDMRKSASISEFEFRKSVMKIRAHNCFFDRGLDSGDVLDVDEVKLQLIQSGEGMEWEQQVEDLFVKIVESGKDTISLEELVEAIGEYDCSPLHESLTL